MIARLLAASLSPLALAGFLNGTAAARTSCKMPSIEASEAAWSEYRECDRKERDARIGKYFCFFNNVLGIQYPVKDGFPERDKTPFVGKIVPKEGKFFMEITKNSLGDKGYRLTSKSDITPSVAVSEDAFKFESSIDTFLFAFDDTFISFQSFGSSYLADGRCEKIN
jgi:hypothetical protein